MAADARSVSAASTLSPVPSAFSVSSTSSNSNTDSPNSQASPALPTSPTSRTSPTSPISAPSPLVESTPAELLEPRRQLSRSRTASVASNAAGRLRSVSLRVLEADFPPGFMAATGSAAARVHTPAEIRRGSLAHLTANNEDAEEEEGSPESGRRRLSRSVTGLSIWSMGRGNKGNDALPADSTPRLAQLPPEVDGTGTLEPMASRGPSHQDRLSADDGVRPIRTNQESMTASIKTGYANTTRTGNSQTSCDNSYISPPELPWTISTVLALKAFWRWFCTPLGFAITIYGLNIVAWGGMLFLLLCNAAPAMCHPSCNDLQSPRRIWIEITSQILNGLFCVTGFGLAPWRFRDLFWWCVWRFGWGQKRGQSKAERKNYGLRRLAGIHRNWFRLPGSNSLPPTTGPKDLAAQADNEAVIPFPAVKVPDPPPTSIRAQPTKLWKMDFVIWCNVWNTFFQCCLAGFMWAMNRYDRPPWSTGLFVALACGVAGMGGISMFNEGKRIKKVEGIPMESWQGKKEYRDLETGQKGNQGKEKDEAEEGKEKAKDAAEKIVTVEQ
ncbi:hypothetical protein IWZ03DRAFT_366131 [Phyllosticta citriasiana]|uniref:Uncharacterized protein n=1 Tax=Phyllosticta citriasiana TaxID=595635 RepID=A0ABR1KYW5_9PEZI